MTRTPHGGLTATELILVFAVLAVGFIAQEPDGSAGVLFVFVLAAAVILVVQRLYGRVASWLLE